MVEVDAGPEALERHLHVPLLHGGVESVPDIAGGGHGPRAVVELVHVRRHRQEPGHTCDRRFTRP